MPCTCSESFTVTDTWESEFYIVPKASTDNLPQNPSCNCGSGQSEGCKDAPSGSPGGLSTQTSQDPQSGKKVPIGEAKKTNSTKDPEKAKCSGNCGSSTGPVTILKDESIPTGNTKTVSVKIKIVDAWLDCKCTSEGEYGSQRHWRVPCPDYETTVDVDAEIYKRTRVQQYTLSVDCKN